MATDNKNPPLLVPVDFSSHSEAALEFAISLADLLDAPVVVLHIVHDPGESPGFYAGKTGRPGVERMEEVAGRMMSDFMREFAAKHPGSKALETASTMLRIGIPVTRILEAVESLDARMVIMGSLGRTGFKHMLIGSKAEQIVRLCPVPVTIVKCDADSEAQ